MHSKFTSPHRAPTSIFLFGAHAKTLSAPYKMLLADCDSVSHSKLKPGKEENEGPCLSRLVSYRVLNQWIDAHRIAKKADSRCGWPRDMVPWLSHEALQCWWRSHDRFISLSLVLVSKFKWFNQAKNGRRKTVHAIHFQLAPVAHNVSCNYFVPFRWHRQRRKSACSLSKYSPTLQGL